MSQKPPYRLEEGELVIGYKDDGGDKNDSDDTIEHGDNEREVFTVNSEENLLDTAMYWVELAL